MKRDAAAGDPGPDGENWIRFAENTPNDGSEVITIPGGLTEASDWHFFVRHSASDVFDASDEPFTYDEADYNQCDFTYVLPSSQWRQVSLPCDPGANNTVADVFGDDNLGENYTTDWVVYRYDTTADNYARLALNDPLIQGVGYWIIQTTDSAQTLDLPADSTPTPITHPTGCSAANGCFEIPLATQSAKVQWNMIGYPFVSAQSMGDDTKVVTSTGDCISGCTLSDAEASKIVHNEFWTYNGANFTKMGIGGHFNPWMGFWSATLKSSEGTQPRLLVPKP